MASSKLLDFMVRTANEPDLVSDLQALPHDELVKSLVHNHHLTHVQARAIVAGDFDTVSSEVQRELLSGVKAESIPPVNLVVGMPPTHMFQLTSRTKLEPNL